ncbi:hypothetical protein [Ekhidna sp.]|uniref:hypothetical protein n=1 Tax=Ekhidna sp. TaxID=2608089 RepID=UPI003B508101
MKFLKISLVFIPSLIQAQSWEKTGELKINKSASYYTADIQGNFYLGFKDGGLVKYNSEGELLENFALSNSSSITLIDVQNNLKPFIFYFDNQQITILDRFSSVPKNYYLQDYSVQLGMIACPAPDGDIWVIENNPQRLIKISTLRKSVVLEVQLDLGDSINKIQAYQNLLIVGHNQGIHVLDQYGGRVYSKQISDMRYFQLINDQLLAFTQGGILQFDPISGRDIGKISLKGNPDGVLKLKEKFLYINDRKLSFYNYTE